MADKASFQVIVLGPTGGPREDSITGLLVRSTSTQWSSNSVIAVDAGTLISGIIRTLEQHLVESDDGMRVMKEGPFAGLRLPYKTAQANAAHIFREIIGAVLITHAHLDHLSGLAINTPMLEAGNGPKPVAALPSVVAAIKNHMFNDVIWPNLSDEDGGAGLLTYQRMIEGGNPRFGRGDARGYVRACEGLLSRCFGVSHGRCRQRFHPETGKHHRVGSTVFAIDPLMASRAISVDLTTDASFYSSAPGSPRLFASNPKESMWATVESSAFFIRDHLTNSEIIIFGDLEPDSISLDPRNKRVWEIAAPKIASGALRAIFIECSYDDSVDDASLYGHLCPRHLIAELAVLAGKVYEAQQLSTGKRKRSSGATTTEAEVSPTTKRLQSFTFESKRASMSLIQTSAPSETQSRVNSGGYLGEIPEIVYDGQTSSYQDPLDGGEDRSKSPIMPEDTLGTGTGPLPLAGLSVYVIHIKEDLSDGPPPGDRILRELRYQAEAAGLGCEFYVPQRGEGIWI